MSEQNAGNADSIQNAVPIPEVDGIFFRRTKEGVELPAGVPTDRTHTDNSRPAGNGEVTLPEPTDERGTPIFIKDMKKRNPEAFDFSSIPDRDEAEYNEYIKDGPEPSLNQLLGLPDPPRRFKGLNFYPITLSLGEMQEIMEMAKGFNTEGDLISVFEGMIRFAQFVLYVDTYEVIVNEKKKAQTVKIAELGVSVTAEQIEQIVSKTNEEISALDRVRESAISTEDGIRPILRRATLEEIRNHVDPTVIDDIVKVYTGVSFVDAPDGKKN